MSNHSVLHYVFRVRRAPRFCCLIISAPVQAIALGEGVSRPNAIPLGPARGSMSFRSGLETKTWMAGPSPAKRLTG